MLLGSSAFASLVSLCRTLSVDFLFLSVVLREGSSHEVVPSVDRNQ